MTEGDKRFPAADQRGIALIYVVCITIILMLLLGTSTMYTIASIKAGQKELNHSVEAKNVAQTGLQMAHMWFTQQASQPVHQVPAAGLWADMAFYPRYNTTYALSATDKDTPSSPAIPGERIGLEHDMAISNDNRLWGHYLVPRQYKNNNNDTTKGGSIANQANNDDSAVRDVSNLRIRNAAKGAGLAWRITSYGYVYYRPQSAMTQGTDGVFTTAYNQAPNKILDRAVAQMELDKLTISLNPAAAILYDGAGSTLSISGGTLINGASNTGIAYSSASNAPSGVTSGSGANVQGATATQQVPGLNLSPSVIFGMLPNDIQGIADQSVTQVSDLVWPLPSMGILFINGTANFTSAQPLSGGGILYVTGNLNLPQDASCSYSGIVYVGGNLTMGGTNFISGSVIVRGNTTFNVTADKATVEYSQSVVNLITSNLGNYRANNLTMKINAL